jgi:hypothetical protein
MGLQEKRAVKEFQDNHLSKLTKEVNAAAGFDVPMEIDWNSLMVNEYSHLYTEGFTKVYFTTLTLAFKEIAADDMGKEALKSTLKKVVIKNSNDHYSASSAISFENGVLTFDHTPISNVDQYVDRAKYMADLMMKQM